MTDDADRPRKAKRQRGDPRATRFMTCSCEHRLPLFHRAATRDASAENLLGVVLAGDLRLVAWVLMPEHLHLLVMGGRLPLARALGGLKSRFARDTFALWEVERPAALRPLIRKDNTRRFWLTGGGYDRWIRGDDDLREKVNYVHQNPVRRGLVARAEDWRWSSLGTPIRALRLPHLR
ncbi:putative transposase for insertion sequence element [Phycisphaera mikurensis NBRC 102666]|uniref:Putative transposase for insertion sequence element n=2 Tax=Phycisphaera TaxID=666508 RepID=I0IJA8_PHYMF|nr:transposase [Phycisphaera mikurensis]MBB6441854.1 putative transposase [Phycisphaera mikurensis]BAM05346.1 putative transposase for insertion sequence element [Phycisphaera mikurensis NBRC 102666]